MFEVGMKQLALIIDVQRLDCTCWVSLVCVGNSTSVVGRILSSTWGLSSLLSASCRREITDFSEFSQFWWLHGCGVPMCIAISLLERKIHLGQSKEKAKEFKNKELWQLYSEVWSEGKCFQALPNFLIQAVPFGEPRAGGNLQCFVCQQPMAPPLPSPLWPLPYTLSFREGRNWKLGCPGTFPIHKNLLLPPRQRRSKKGRESPELSKFKLPLPSSMAAFLSSEGIRLITLSTAFCCLLGAATPVQRF